MRAGDDILAPSPNLSRRGERKWGGVRGGMGISDTFPSPSMGEGRERVNHQGGGNKLQ